MKRFLDWLKRFWFTLTGGYRKFVKPAIEVVQWLKHVIESKELDALVSITPSQTDDVILIRARELLANALKALQFADNFSLAAKEMSRLNSELRKPIYNRLAAKVIEQLSEEKVDISDAVILAELGYQRYKKE